MAYQDDDQEPKPAPNQEQYADLLEEARDRFNEAEEAEREIREEALKDLKFLAGDQWDQKDKTDRVRAFRPVLTFNKLAPMVQSVSNQVRQNKPSIKVHPEDGTARKETAEVYQGLIRHIEYASNAEVAYDSAVESSAGCGFGYFRYTTEYCDDESFEQEIRIERILDPFSVRMDCNAKKPDRSDAMWAFIGDPFSTESDADGDEDDCEPAEYWNVETEKRTRNQYVDGTTGWADEDDGTKGKPVNARDVDVRQVKQYLIKNGEVIEANDWAGKWIPIVPVWGKEMIVEGKRKLFSLIRFARDPQQLYNYYKTSIAEHLSLASKTPWIGYEGQFDADPRWKTANSQNYPYLTIKRETIGGAPAPFPQRNAFEPPIMALTNGAMQEADDIKSTIGIFDPSLGAESQETSGVAIARRQNQANVVNFHFPDNLTRAQVFGGKILLDLIPKIYDTARQVRIIGDDDKAKVVMVNAPYQDETSGKQTSHMLEAGRYGVTVETGPSFTTRREETFQGLMELAGQNQQVMQIAGDLIFRNSDFAGADALADRFEKILPPQLQPQKPDQQSQQQMQQLMAQAQQSGQMIDALTAKVHELHDVIATKKLEMDSRERIAAMQAQVELIKTEASINAQNAQAMLKAELSAIQAKLDAVTSVHSQQADQDHQITMQQADQQHQAGMADLQHQQQMRIQQQAQQQQQQQQQTGDDQQPEAA